MNSLAYFSWPADHCWPSVESVTVPSCQRTALSCRRRSKASCGYGSNCGEAVIVLGHEEIALPSCEAISLAPFFRIDVPVGHVERLGVAHVDSSCPGPTRPSSFDRNTGRFHVVAKTAHHALFLGGDPDQIVADIGRGRVEVLPVLGAVRNRRRSPEQFELELGGEIGEIAALYFSAAATWRFRMRAARVRQVLMRVVVLQVAEQQRVFSSHGTLRIVERSGLLTKSP